MTTTWRASDVRFTDLMLGVLIAVAILLCAGTLLLHAGFTRPAVAASQEQEPIAAVTVQAVEGRGGGAEPEAAVEPDVPEPPEEVAVEESTLPRVLEQMIERMPEEPPPERRRPVRRARSVVVTQTAAVAGVPGAGDAGPPSAGEGSDDGEAFVSRYRAMLRQWLAVHVRLRDTGLAATELDGKRIRITLEIDHARTVTRVEIVPTGTVAFDRAMLEAVAALEGKTLPEPPEGYPGPLQRRIPAIFVCNPGACR